MKIVVDWDLELILKLSQMEAEKERVISESYKFINKWKDREDYLTDPKILAEALSEYEEWERGTGLFGKLWYFWNLSSLLNQTDPEIKAKLGQVIELANKLQNDIQFFEHKVARVKPIKDNILVPYQHFLDRLWKNAKYLLSEPEEKVMNLKADSAHTAWERMTSGLVSREEREILAKNDEKDSDQEYRKIKKNFSEIYNAISDVDKKVRDSAYFALIEIVDRWVDVGEAEMNAILNDKKINDELRGMKRPDEGRHAADDVETEMVDTLVASVSEKFEIPAKFYQFKAKLLGVEKLEYYERMVPYGNIEKSFSLEQGTDLILKVFEKLGSSYADIFSRLFENGQVDVYPKTGKRGGAFCAHEMISDPTFVLLNFNNKLEGLLNMAHEFGHAINNELMRDQSPFYFHTSLATAEVASTFFEGFVRDEILREADGELRLALLVKQLDDDMGTIFRQVAIYKFESDLHAEFRRKGYLSEEEIGKIWLSNAILSMGPFVNKTPGCENWWLFVPHIREFFYVYSYASGQLISKALQQKVKENPDFMSKIREFLAAGSSKSPSNLFLDMGIDVSKKDFWQTGLSEISGKLEEAEKLAKSLKKV